MVCSPSSSGKVSCCKFQSLINAQSALSFPHQSAATLMIDTHQEGQDKFSAFNFLSSECNHKMTVNMNNEGEDEVWKITLDRSACRIRRKLSQKPPLDCRRLQVEHCSATATQICPSCKVISKKKKKLSPSSLLQNSASEIWKRTSKQAWCI